MEKKDELNSLVKQLTAEMFFYPERENNVRRLNEYISNGDMHMAELMAKQIYERQCSVRQLQVSGLPAYLQSLINQLTAEVISYPERENNVRRLNEYISNGDMHMAEIMANQIYERQCSVRQLQVSGPPAYLQSLINQLTAEVISYPERENNVRRLNEYISNGDMHMAEIMANQICERQRNVKLFQN
ncbi:hypothetical protein [Proteus terrae]|uniref:hypothetical protein n=2 Tax=Proteus terrae TaxID=1574161 RepID=UPI0018E7BB01|nr:hypothetical protein [Proteus terrae]MBJ2132237.1 hypothetical protein [Proteus terrae]